jgi:hypothetical protein
LPQNPHAVREPKENNLEQAMGHEVWACRKKLGITVADLASHTGLSVGMLSKIENGVISPSMTMTRSPRAASSAIPSSIAGTSKSDDRGRAFPRTLPSNSSSSAARDDDRFLPPGRWAAPENAGRLGVNERNRPARASRGANRLLWHYTDSLTGSAGVPRMRP